MGRIVMFRSNVPWYLNSILDVFVDFPSSSFCCYSMSFYIFFLFFDLFASPMKHRSDDPIGGPSPLPPTQLPTHRDVARQWQQTRADLQAANPGTIVTNKMVAQKVKNGMKNKFFIFLNCILVHVKIRRSKITRDKRMDGPLDKLIIIQWCR